MIIVSTGEFREKQRSYLEKVDQGIQILIKGRNGKAYKITPIADNDVVISNPSPSNDEYFNIPENIEELKKSILEAEQGKVIRLKHGDIKKILGL
jgi:hypothetical protein